jgi:hypothetical protein
MLRRALAVAAFPAALAFALLAAPRAARADGWRWRWNEGVRGDGHKVTQPREVAAFSSVRLEGSLDVRVKIGPPRAVSVTIDENLQPLVLTRVEGDTLVVDTRNISYQGEGRVELTTPSLRGFAIEGSGDVTIDGAGAAGPKGDLTLSVSGSGDFDWRGVAARLDVSIEGSGDVKLDGQADEARVSIEGSGDVKGARLTARSAEVHVSGSGDAELTLAGGRLSASVEGSGDVVWHGTAQVDRADVSGSGSVVRR